MKELPGLIPNFFYDLICRIVPGGVTIFACNPKWIPESNAAIEVSSLLLASWAVGMTLDVLTAAVLMPFKEPILGWLKKKEWANFFLNLKELQLESEKGGQLIPSIYDLELGRLNSILRAMADVAFFRVMAIISVSFGVLSMGRGYESPFKLAWWAWAILATLFCICWLRRYVELQAQVSKANEDFEKKGKGSHNQLSACSSDTEKS